MSLSNASSNLAGTINGGGNGVNSSTSSYSYFNEETEGSSNPSIQNLTAGSKWGSSTFGSALTLTYSYSSANSAYSYNNTATAGVVPIVNAQITAIEQINALYANVANITWQQVTDSANAAGDIRWNNSSDTNIGTAYAYYPSSSAIGGDVWIGPNYSSYQNPTIGGYAYLTLIHELGHAMGMNHPHEGQVAAQPHEDQLKYSVMSYRGYDGQPTNAGYSTSYYPTTLMLNDIATMQFLYGVNTTYQTGDNTYSWASNVRIYETIWDAGGSDTLSAAGQAQGCVLYLTAGKWSQIGVAFSNGQSSVRDNLTIAYGCVIENALGSAHADTIEGNAVANHLNGGTGNDSILGGDGNDTLVGGAGNDTLNGGSGVDWIDYSAASAAVNVALWQAQASNDGNSGVDSLSNIENVRGSSGNDTIAGHGGANRLEGMDGNDTLIGDGGADTLDGGSGTDTIDYTGTTGNLNVALWRGQTLNNGAGAINTLISIENVRGGNGNDYLSGNGAANKLEGGNGNDTLQGDGGADTLDGGAGTDTIDYSGTSGNLNVALWRNQTLNNGANLVNTLSSIENVRGGNGNDTIAGNGVANKLEGGNGNDTLLGDGGADTLDGGAGTDTIDYSGTSGNLNVALWRNQTLNNGANLVNTLSSIENVRGGNGNDMLAGNGVANKLEGMNGNDTLLGDGGADTLDGGAGTDTIDYSGTSGNLNVALWRNQTLNNGANLTNTLVSIENVRGGSGNDMLAGNGIANKLEGMNGNDTLLGDGGADTLDGGAGTDTIDYFASTGSVVVNLALNQTTNNGASVANTLVSIENARSGSGNDSLTGSSAANLLEGNTGHDTISGGEGADTLAGGNGNDSLSGGTEADIFRFDTTPNASTNLDTLPDFTPGSDKLQFENAIFTVLGSAGVLSSGMLRAGAGVNSAADANDYLLYNSSTGALYYDADANGGGQSPIQIAVLPVSLTGLANTDFTII